MNPILKIHEKDNVGTCLRKLEAQETIPFDKCNITATEPIPQYHKIALTHIPIHNPVYKYGQIIGLATKEISQGDYVHVHNIESKRGRGDKKEEC
ncbi:UxaA family hydrolase [Anaerotignum propionicum]|jgi:altronate dehydratase small subunit|uniref:Altronate dehydratase n=1 Tax=Anaerotignum propionicum DSM 1682 TaxID=991789 RepID=A0A0X1U826_ANAPI|nr:UxaA family hydrolase [Anaerotignum propionicum]AMJ41081.1 altronate dehydratase [Anaerotignum propionicum DSM 1682]SHE63050.1 altronate dehydratase small subunit [[Clostridium] propionicum DSM 1682] [Anaerotignum propionicum DSM 1682]HBF66536.1 altronate hydrolase [Clostridium sp.]